MSRGSDPPGLGNEIAVQAIGADTRCQKEIAPAGPPPLFTMLFTMPAIYETKVRFRIHYTGIQYMGHPLQRGLPPLPDSREVATP